MSVNAPSAGTYLLIAYIHGAKAWANGVTDLANSGYWCLDSDCGGAKIYENVSSGQSFNFRNITGSAATYAGSYMFLIKLS